MKLTKNQLREQKVYNEHNYADLQDDPYKVWVSYTPTDRNSRSMTVSGWYVHRNGYRTDPKDRTGSKCFVDHGRRDKEEKRLEAIAWATERYGIQEWERSPFGSYHPVGTMAKAVAIHKEKSNGANNN